MGKGTERTSVVQQHLQLTCFLTPPLPLPSPLASCAAMRTCLSVVSHSAHVGLEPAQEAHVAARKPATSARACQTQGAAGGSEAADAEALRGRVSRLESEAADAAKAQRALRDKLNEAEAELRRLSTAAAGAEDVRQKLEAERRLVWELQSQLGRSSTEAAAAATRLTEVRAKVLDLEGQLRGRAAAASVEAGTIRELQSKLDAATSREASTRRELEDASAMRRRAENDAEALRRRLTEAEAALAAARREASAAVERGDRKSAELAARWAGAVPAAAGRAVLVL
jgi:chromosome segregation ATPase